MYSILIVDDEELIRNGIIAKIKYNNFKFTELFEAEDGEQALPELALPGSRGLGIAHAAFLFCLPCLIMWSRIGANILASRVANMTAAAQAEKVRFTTTRFPT